MPSYRVGPEHATLFRFGCKGKAEGARRRDPRPTATPARRSWSRRLGPEPVHLGPAPRPAFWIWPSSRARSSRTARRGDRPPAWASSRACRHWTVHTIAKSVRASGTSVISFTISSTSVASDDARWSLATRHSIEASTRTWPCRAGRADRRFQAPAAFQTRFHGSGSPPELTETESETSRSVPTQRRNSTLSAPAETRRPSEGRRTTTTPCEARPSCPATASIPTTRRTAGSDGKATGEDAPHVRRPRDQPCQLRTRTARPAGDPRRVVWARDRSCLGPAQRRAFGIWPRSRARSSRAARRGDRPPAWAASTACRQWIVHAFAKGRPRERNVGDRVDALVHLGRLIDATGSLATRHFIDASTRTWPCRVGRV